MTKWIAQALIALSLSLIETSFFASFHGLLKFTPFVLLTSVYLLQHHGMKNTIWWMLIHGILLDVSGIAPVPFVTFAYILAAWVAYVSADTVFSNRSFYGVAACACTSFIAFEFGLACLHGSDVFLAKESFKWGTFFVDAWGRFLMMFLFLSILFAFAKQIRRLLIRTGLISPLRQTY